MYIPDKSDGSTEFKMSPTGFDQSILEEILSDNLYDNHRETDNISSWGSSEENQTLGDVYHDFDHQITCLFHELFDVSLMWLLFFF